MLLVLDLSKVMTNSTIPMVAGVAAGCNAVRVALSPDGATVYVTARGDNALHVLDSARLLADPTHAQKSVITVGTSPVGIAVSGSLIFLANSDRFGGGENQTVSVLDAGRPEAAARAIPAGGFPRELKLTADGNTLLLTNFATQTLELVDLKRLDQAVK
jgi:YVTN family beta-propeller protein